LWAQHTVPYHHLPGYFILFDIYDRKAGEFYSVRRRDAYVQEMLGGEHLSGEAPPIPIVPCVAHRVFENLEEVLMLMDQVSAYGEGRMEGVYLRLDDDADEGGGGGGGVGGWLKARGKIVTRDFVQAVQEGDHWTAKGIVRNRVVV